MRDCSFISLVCLGWRNWFSPHSAPTVHCSCWTLVWGCWEAPTHDPHPLSFTRSEGPGGPSWGLVVSASVSLSLCLAPELSFRPKSHQDVESSGPESFPVRWLCQQLLVRQGTPWVGGEGTVGWQGGAGRGDAALGTDWRGWDVEREGGCG